MNRWFEAINSWFRPQFEADENALEQFERLWNEQESGRSITFMSIAFTTSKSPVEEIEDIGLSYWSKQGLQQQVAYHWHVEEKVEAKDVVEFSDLYSFEFGTTQPITAHGIKTVLDDWALSLSGSCEELCIVMYGEQPIQTLRRHWKSPVSVTVLDINAAWRQRHHETENSTLEEKVSTTKQTANTIDNLHHAGNQAYCLLTLLTPLGKKSRNLTPGWEEPNE